MSSLTKQRGHVRIPPLDLDQVHSILPGSLSIRFECQLESAQGQEGGLAPAPSPPDSQFLPADPATLRVSVSVGGSAITFSIIFPSAVISCSPDPIAMKRIFPRRSIRKDMGMENTP